jgi:ribosome-associated protein
MRNERLEAKNQSFSAEQAGQLMNPGRKEWIIEPMRSSGPGGQHAQKTESRVRARWNFEVSPELSEEERSRLREKFPEGYIEAMSQRTRSQRKNIEIAKAQIIERMRVALALQKTRIPTRVPGAVQKARLEEKRRASMKKKLRAAPSGDAE